MTWLLALTGLAAETEVVRALQDRKPHRVTDVVDMLAAARSQRCEGVLVAARFPHMSREIAVALGRSGVAVHCLADVSDDVGERTAAQWGVPVTRLRSPGDAAAVIDGVTEGARHPVSVGPRGPIVAVVAPAGAPGATTVAVNTALRLTAPALLVDADHRAPSVGFHLGLPDDVVGVRGAVRQAALGRLNAQRLLASCHDISGIPVLPTRSGERVDDALADVIHATARTVVVDCGSDLEASLPLLSRAALVVTVAVPTAVGIRRWLDVVPAVRELSAAPRMTVWNQVRGERQGGRLGRAPAARLRALTARVDPTSASVSLPFIEKYVARRGPWPRRGGSRALSVLVREIEAGAAAAGRTAPEPDGAEKGAGPLGIRVRGALRSA